MSTDSDTTASYCGDQYNNKGCACIPQVTAGLTPATQESADTTLVCAYQENGIQYGCDTGCCPSGTCTGTPGTSNAVAAAAGTSSADAAAAGTSSADAAAAAGTSNADADTIYWVMLILSIMYMIMLIGGFVFAVTRRK